jgi:hypothetical protein
MGLHGLLRATEDIDLLIKATPANVERFPVSLRATYDAGPLIEEISTSDLPGDYLAVRYYPPPICIFDAMTRLDEMAGFDPSRAK